MKSLLVTAVALLASLALVACGGGEPPPVVSPTAASAAWTQTHLQLVNEARAEVGAPSLHWNELLAEVALAHARDMQQRRYFAHQSPEGDDVADRLAATSYPIGAVGENLAHGNRRQSQVIEAWLNSPGHRENMLFGDYQEMGAARYGDYWVQVFARPVTMMQAPTGDG